MAMTVTIVQSILVSPDVQPVEIAGDDERRLQTVCLTGIANPSIGLLL
jgi:hypothetical protein